MNTFFINVEVALYRDDTWLMIVRAGDESHAAGLLSFPGGTVEEADGPDAPFEKTAVREIAEEAGLQITGPLEYIHSSSFTSDTGEKVINIVMCGVAPEGDTTLSPEVASLHWLTAAEILSNPKCPPWLRVSMDLAEKHRTTVK